MTDFGSFSGEVNVFTGLRKQAVILIVVCPRHQGPGFHDISFVEAFDRKIAGASMFFAWPLCHKGT
jgi:hypothetical protein